VGGSYLLLGFYCPITDVGFLSMGEYSMFDYDNDSTEDTDVEYEPTEEAIQKSLQLKELFDDFDA
jgi:hypothetical protein